MKREYKRCVKGTETNLPRQKPKKTQLERVNAVEKNALSKSSRVSVLVYSFTSIVQQSWVPQTSGFPVALCCRTCRWSRLSSRMGWGVEQWRAAHQCGGCRRVVGVTAVIGVVTVVAVIGVVAVICVVAVISVVAV